ncbi:hypothetical protein [Streptomyces achromogenes]|uniref:hypothetical protein n=1 Tax=Streptomyces achromogenes TaxID=67255 RepID=UPI00369F18DE
MATWQHFIELLTQEVGAENVEGGADDNKAVVTVKLTAAEGTTEPRRQKVHFEYDGKDTSWIAVTSFVLSSTEGVNVAPFLKALGEDWRKPAAVIVDGQLALRHHISLSALDGDGDGDTDEQIIKIAFLSTAVIGSLADYYEGLLTKKDVK